MRQLTEPKFTKGTITVTEPDNAKTIKPVIFKNNAPFINSFQKSIGKPINNAKDLVVVISINNMLENNSIKIWLTLFKDGKINSKNSKTNESHRSGLDLSDKADLKDPKENMALANFSIYYTYKKD